MIPIGYMLKRVVPPPSWMNAPTVKLVYSVSGCVSLNFMDYIPLWKHNVWWLFDEPSTLRGLAAEHRCDQGLALFYFEAFEQEYDADRQAWRPVEPEASFHTNVKEPDHKILRGYDIVTFFAHTSPECSPLSCCSLARTIPTNQYCLLDDFDVAHDLAEQEVIHGSEPGPYRIISVYTVGEVSN